jgi:hypothetical protein
MRDSDERGLDTLSLDLGPLALIEADFQVSSSNAHQSSPAYE